jgi:hypothetical protein
MQINNGQLIYNNNRNNSCGTKLFKIPIKKLNIQSRNINSPENSILKMNNMKKNSLYSTKEATPRKEHNKVLTTKKMKEPKDDDSLSQITEILKKDKKNLRYSDLVGKIPGIDNDDEPNFIFNQILYNKSKINKAKKISHKIGVLKFSIPNTHNISSKETLSNSDRSKRDSFNNKKKNEDDSVGVSCCFFGRK